MEKQRLNFKRKPGDLEEYLILNHKNQPLGDIVYWKVGRKKDWWFFPHFHPMDGEHDFWLGEDCLREVADFLNKLKTSHKEAL